MTDTNPTTANQINQKVDAVHDKATELLNVGTSHVKELLDRVTADAGSAIDSTKNKLLVWLADVEAHLGKK